VALGLVGVEPELGLELELLVVETEHDEMSGTRGQLKLPQKLVLAKLVERELVVLGVADLHQEDRKEGGW
jgi:hypothetical protein